MVGKHTVLHIVELLAAVVCAHHFWPKGITYGEQEEWEKKLHQKAHHVSSKAKGKSKASSARGSGGRGRERRGGGRAGASVEKEHGRVRRRDRDRDGDREDRYYDDEGVRGERRGYDDRNYDYGYEDRPPRYSKNPDRAGARSVY